MTSRCLCCRPSVCRLDWFSLPGGLFAGLALGLLLAAAAAPAMAQAAGQRPDLDVPYVPTRPAVVDALLELGEVTGQDFLIDLGCGDGRIVNAAAKRFGTRGLGVDIDPQRIREARALAEENGVTELVEFREADLFETDIRRADVVTMFLLNSVNLRLRPKLFRELRPGTRIVSHAFSMDDWEPDRQVTHEQAHGSTLYRWVIPAGVGGTWRWEARIDGRRQPVTAKLTQEFQKLRGTLRVGDGPEQPIETGRVNGREVSFTAPISSGGEHVGVIFTGVLAGEGDDAVRAAPVSGQGDAPNRLAGAGDMLRGNAEWTGGPRPGPQDWSARREPVDLAGRWRIETSDPELAGTLTLARDTHGLLAVFEPEREELLAREVARHNAPAGPGAKAGENGQAGGPAPDVLGSDGKPGSVPLTGCYLWGTSLRFELPRPGGKVIFRGTLEDDSGSGELSGVSGTTDRTWTAQRVAGPGNQETRPAAQPAVTDRR